MKTTNNAEFFFEMLNEVYYNLHDGYFKTENHHYRSDCANGYITIHHSKKREDEPDGTYYHIDINGNVFRKNVFEYTNVKLSLSDLDGDDFELFNSIQVYKCGYVVLEAPTDIDYKGYAKKVLSNLHNHIASFEPDFWKRHSGEERNYPLLVGGSSWDNGLTDEFQYASINGVEIHVQTIHEFCKENENRKYFGCSPIPFRKDMDSNVAFHITIIDFERKGLTDERRMRQCNDAIKELMGYIKNTLIPTREYDFDNMSYKSFPVKNAKWINTCIKGILFEN